MENKSVFISSCSRRELARRRPSRTAGQLEMYIALAVLVVAVFAFVIVRGGL